MYQSCHERVHFGEQRLQQMLVQPQRQRERVEPCAGARCPAPAPPDQQRRQQQHVHVQIDDEPQVMPAEIPSRIQLETEHAFDEERGVASVPVSVDHPFDEDLRRNDHEHAEEDRHQQSKRPLADERGCRASPEREPQSRAGDDEQQRHAESVREVHRELQCRDRLAVDDVPAPAHEQHARVIEQQHEDRDHAKPVEEVVSLRRSRRDHRCLPCGGEQRPTPGISRAMSLG